MTKVGVKLLHKTARYPVYGSDQAAGADLYARLLDTVYLYPGDRIMIQTGIALDIPEGFEGQVRSRSGMALHYGVSVLNSPGTIDSDYTGEVCIILINQGEETFVIKPDARIAQLVIAPVVRADFHPLKDEIKETERGAGGFGSTGQM